jgi:hypothetical protein
LNDQWVIEEIRKEIKKFPYSKENANKPMRTCGIQQMQCKGESL